MKIFTFTPCLDEGIGAETIKYHSMTVKVPLSNKPELSVELDEEIFEELSKDERLTSLKFFDNLRRHSNGYAFFQRYISHKASPKYETIYLHKLIAERYIERPKTDKKLFVRFINGNVRDVRLRNLEWVTMNTLRRNMNYSSGTTGYRGVTIDRGKFRAVIYNGDKKYDLGFFEVAEEAAKAYNEKSIELFGVTNGLNKVD